MPLTIALRVNSDAGDPTANFAPARGGGATALARALEGIVESVQKQAALASVRRDAGAPRLTIS